MSFNSKIVRFNIDSKLEQQATEFFDSVDSYYDIAKDWVYTEINMGYKKSKKEIFESRLQMILSRILLRSIYLHEGAILEINNNNIVGLFAILKSLIEVTAVMGYILYLLNTKMSSEKIFDLLAEIYLGDRGDGELSIGDKEIKNILTMFEKTKKELGEIGEIMFDFYQLVCNYGHPNYTAHSLLGTIHDDRVFRLVSQKDYKKIKREEFNSYKPAWCTALLVIQHLYTEIVTHPKVKKFGNIRSKKYFNEK